MTARSNTTQLRERLWGASSASDDSAPPPKTSGSSSRARTTFPDWYGECDDRAHIYTPLKCDFPIGASGQLFKDFKIGASRSMFDWRSCACRNNTGL
ncbi:hypothetical protein BST61_g8224 [Cercospora zeina]